MAGPNLGGEVFPLPRVDGPWSRVVGSRDKTTRRDSKLGCHKLRVLNEICGALNWMHGAAFTLQPRVASAAQQEVQRRLAILTDSAWPREVPPLPETALRELLKGRCIYEVDGTPLNLAAFTDGTLSLPSDVSDAPRVLDLLPEGARFFLKDIERMMRPAAETATMREEQPIVPYTCRSLRTRRIYKKMIGMLQSRGMLRWTTRPRCHVGVFFVKKKDPTKLRLILDCRVANQYFADAPGSVLGGAEALSRIEVELPDTLDPKSDEASELLDKMRVHLGVGDIADAFHRLVMPESMSPWFAFPYDVLAGDFEVATADSGETVSPDMRVWPCARSLPMGFSWSLFYCQAQAEFRMEKLPSLQSSRLHHDRSGVMNFKVSGGKKEGAGGAECITSHTVYVDNLAVFSSDLSAVDASTREMREDFSGSGLKIHESRVMEGGGELLGIVCDGRRLRTTLTEKRLWRLRQALAAVLRRGRASGEMMDVVLGHCTFCSLVVRVSMSVFHAVYAFRNMAMGKHLRLWKAVDLELRAFRALLVVIGSDWTTQWSSLVTATDASLSGFGIATSWWPRSVVTSCGRVSERTRFRRRGPVQARESAMLAAGFELIDGVWEAGGEGEHRDEIDVDCRGEWEFDSKFPEVPAEFLRGELW